MLIQYLFACSDHVMFWGLYTLGITAHSSQWIMILCFSLALPFFYILLLIFLFPPLLFSAYNGGVEVNGKSPKRIPSSFDVFCKFWKRCTLETVKGDVVTGMWLVSCKFFHFCPSSFIRGKIRKSLNLSWLLLYVLFHM